MKLALHLVGFGLAIVTVGGSLTLGQNRAQSAVVCSPGFITFEELVLEADRVVLADVTQAGDSQNSAPTATLPRLAKRRRRSATMDRSTSQGWAPR